MGAIHKKRKIQVKKEDLSTNVHSSRKGDSGWMIASSELGITFY